MFELVLYNIGKALLIIALICFVAAMVCVMRILVTDLIEERAERRKARCSKNETGK